MLASLFAVNIYSFSAREQEPFEQPSGGTSRFMIRTMRPQDIAELSTMLAESFHLQTNFMRWLVPIMRMGIYEDLRNRLRSTPAYYVCMVAIAPAHLPDGIEHLGGTIELTLRHTAPWSICQPRYPYLSNLAVRTECRRQGIARHLLSACERVVLDWGFQDIYLHVLESNYPARQLYLKAGYQVQETDSNWGYWLFGQPRRLFLHKHLVHHSSLD